MPAAGTDDGSAHGARGAVLQRARSRHDVRWPEQDSVRDQLKSWAGKVKQRCVGRGGGGGGRRAAPGSAMRGATAARSGRPGSSPPA
jgi:hypothetical protein